ncbi:MAG TPA: Uma2 family endonuclease, partial [Candidatus Eisenbergiella stercorigallinarum]|nr:Uma2 family endonuclease [Candidatus Eisenbergiella stercorigallinarum]
MPLPQEKIYTTDDIYALPDGQRAELIDGQMFMTAPPTRKHQEIIGELFAVIREYILRHK